MQICARQISTVHYAATGPYTTRHYIGQSAGYVHFALCVYVRCTTVRSIMLCTDYTFQIGESSVDNGLQLTDNDKSLLFSTPNAQQMTVMSLTSHFQFATTKQTIGHGPLRWTIHVTDANPQAMPYFGIAPPRVFEVHTVDQLTSHIDFCALHL